MTDDWEIVNGVFVQKTRMILGNLDLSGRADLVWFKKAYVQGDVALKGCYNLQEIEDVRIIGNLSTQDCPKLVWPFFNIMVAGDVF